MGPPLRVCDFCVRVVSVVPKLFRKFLIKFKTKYARSVNETQFLTVKDLLIYIHAIVHVCLLWTSIKPVNYHSYTMTFINLSNTIITRGLFAIMF